MPSLPSITLNFPNYISSVNLISDLRLINVANEISGRNVVVDAGVVAGDGLGGVFVWNPAGSDPDDGITCVAPASGLSGRWQTISRNTTVVIPPVIDAQRSVTTRTQMSSLDVTIGKRVAVAAELSLFDWTFGSFTAQVAADPTHTVYQPHATIPITTGCFVCVSPAIASTKVDQTRLINSSGLVSGGGDLTADRTINVTKASSTDVMAGTADDRAITPLALKTSRVGTFSVAAGAAYAVSGYDTSANGIITQWGQVRTSITGSYTISFPKAFPNNCFTITTTAQNTGANGGTLYDSWTQNVSRTLSSFTILMQSSVGSASIDGFDFIAIGN
jgi:hypothetical protein